MTVRIFRPAKTAMSSGVANTKLWVLEYSPSSAREVDPLMGWTSSGDMQSQIRLNFASKEAAVEYAKSKGLHFIISEPQKRRPNIRKRGYGENFATDRRSLWTH